MATNHWLTGGGSRAVPNANTPVTTNFSIPANATVRRLMVRQISVQGYSTSTTNNGCTPMAILHTFTFTTGKYGFRSIWSSFHAVPWNVTYVVVGPVNVYNSWYNGGDAELGMNHRCAYGGLGAPAANLQYQFSSFYFQGTGQWVQSQVNWQVAVLYSL